MNKKIISIAVASAITAMAAGVVADNDKQSWYSITSKGAVEADVMIYDEIGYWGVTAKAFATDIKALGDVKLINLFLNSIGGSIIDGTAIYNTLKNHNARVVVHIDGVALSMGSIIAMAGDHINMAENGLMMIHNPQGGAGGEAKDLRKTADIMDKMKANMVNTYVARTGVDAETIESLMDEETWMNAEEALDFGFIDSITGEVELAASFDPTKFNNVPSHILASFVEKPQDKKPAPNQVSAVADPTKVDNTMTEEEKKAAAAKAKADADAIIAKKAADEALANEKTRTDGIRAAFTNHDGHRDLMDECIVNQAMTIDGAKGALLVAIGKKSKATPTGEEHRIEMLADERTKFRAGMSEVIAGLGGSKPADATNEFRGLTALDMAKACLAKAGVSTKGMSKMQIVGASFTHTSSDFPYLLEDSLGKVLRNAYGEFADSWREWCDVGSVPDFKQNSRIQLGSFNSLDTIVEGGEYTAGTVGEDKAVITAATKGKLITMTRQMIINDDLGGLMRIGGMMGRAAARTVNVDVYTLLKANSAMFDGVVMFHADHSNLPTGAAPTAATLGAARTLMRKQQDVDGNGFLNIQPVYIICGVELEDTMNVLLASETDPSKANSKIPNPVRNMAKLITDPNLGATEWYMVAAPSEAPLIEVAFLDGNQTPYLESQAGFNIDGTQMKVRMDYGLSGIDYRGGVKGNS